MVDSAASWSFTITHYDKSSSWASQDITNDAFPRLFTDTGDGKVNAATIRVIAEGGQYIQVGSKTIIDQNDRIRLVADDGNGNTYNRVFDIIKLIPIKSKTEGVMLELNCLGIERWLQQVNYARRVWSKTPHNIFNDLVTTYNEAVSIAGFLPVINLTGSPLEISVNELPTTMKLHKDFGVNEDTIFNRMNELVDSMASPQASGGILDFFDIRFVSSVSNVTSFDIEVFSSGNSNRSKPSITLNGNGSDTNLEESTDGGLDELEGNVINNWGANGAGTLPVSYSQFDSRNIEMPTNLGTQSLFAEWDSSFEYLVSAVIKYTLGSVDKCYRALRTTTNDQPNISTSDWVELTTDDYYGSIVYSPFTIGKGTVWNNGAADPQNTSTFGRSMFDANIIVNGDNESRVWADVAVNSPALINSEWLYDGTDFYDGLRVLVQGVGTGDFVNFSNHIVEYNQEEGIWKSKYELKANQLIAVFDESTVYRYTGSGYDDFTTEHNGLDCFHPMQDSTVTNTVSALQDLTSGSRVNYTGNAFSAISATYRYTPIVNWLDEWDSFVLPSALGTVGTILQYVWPTADGTNDRDTRDWYSAGAWLSMRFPFPRSSFNMAGSVGSVYGGTTSTNIVPVLDTQNMTYTTGGLQGFNNGDDSEDLGQISSVDFMIKNTFTGKLLAGGSEYLSKANFKMGMYLVDKNDNVVRQDFNVPHNDNWWSVSLPISGFEQYRGRKPIYEDTFFTTLIIPPKEIPSVSQFRWHEVVMMIIQCEESYDDNGRYRGASGNELGTGNILWNSGIHQYIEFQIQIDALRFGKPLLVNSGQITTLSKEPEFIQSPDIESYFQLKNNCKAELEKAKFEKKQYDIVSEGGFDIEHGDFFLFDDNEIVYLASPNANEDTNKIELVAKHIEYEFTKGDDGPGGYKRRIVGAKRFT